MKYWSSLILVFIVIGLTSCEQVGCTDPNANNYNEYAVEGGNCTYDNKYYSLWFNEQTSDSLVAMVGSSNNMYIFVKDTNVTLNPNTDFALYSHVANMDPIAFSLSAPDCSSSNFLEGLLRNIRLESSKESGTVLNVYISKSLYTDAPDTNLIWNSALQEGTEDCYSVEVTL